MVAYTPALDLSTCRTTLPQARDRFEEAVGAFFEEIERMGTLNEVLTSCGWWKLAKPARWEPPTYLGQEQHEVKLPA